MPLVLFQRRERGEEFGEGEYAGYPEYSTRSDVLNIGDW